MMSKKLNATVLVTDVSRKCTSSYGNPSYWVTVKTRYNDEFRGYTASNASCGYIASDLVGKKVVIEYRFSKKGNLIIDNMKEVL